MRARLFAIWMTAATLGLGCQSLHYSSDQDLAAGQIVGDSMTMGVAPAATVQTGEDPSLCGSGSCTGQVVPSGPTMAYGAVGCGSYCGTGRPYLQGRMGWGRGTAWPKDKPWCDGRFRDCIHGHCAQGRCGGAVGPEVGAVNYPYYTTRGPRDFLLANPPSIGP